MDLDLEKKLWTRHLYGEQHVNYAGPDCWFLPGRSEPIPGSKSDVQRDESQRGFHCGKESQFGWRGDFGCQLKSIW